jgi:hypothetical protein
MLCDVLSHNITVLSHLFTEKITSGRVGKGAVVFGGRLRSILVRNSQNWLFKWKCLYA